MVKQPGNSSAKKPKFKANHQNIVRYVLLGATLVVAAAGAYVYWPPPPRYLIPGIAVYATCPQPPKMDLLAQIVDRTTYRVGLSSKDDLRECTSFHVVSPLGLDGVIKLKNVHQASDFPEGRKPLTNFKLGTTEVGQPVLDIDPRRISDGLELSINGMIAESFERFRLVIPTSITTTSTSGLGQSAKLQLTSVLVPSQFDILDVWPSPTARKLQMGFTLVYFDNANLHELSLLLLDRDRDWWKSIFNIIAAGTLTSLLASLVYSKMSS